MTKVPPRLLAISFYLLVIVHIAAIISDVYWLRNITKPLLVPVLAAMLLYSPGNTAGARLILTGLFFSWLGDIFLLVKSAGMLYFIAGLVSFLITHVCYIFYFFSKKKDSVSVLKKQPLYILPVVGYAAGLLSLLFPYLGDLRIPVVIYTIVICAMFLSSIDTCFPANRYYVAGAALFVVSDSLLAINKFYHPLPLGDAWVMLSYCAAQYFIVYGCIAHGDDKSTNPLIVLDDNISDS